MALTDNQKALIRLMVTHPIVHVDEVQLKAWSDMPDDEIISVINDWIKQKQGNPNTTQGLIAKIVSLVD